MAYISREMYEINAVETIADKNGTLGLNEKHKEEEWTNKNLQMATGRYHSDHRKHRYELGCEPKKQPSRIIIDK